METTSHFFNPDKYGVALDQVPLSLEELFKKSTAQSPDEINADMGTSWWRINQFFFLAKGQGRKAAASGKSLSDRIHAGLTTKDEIAQKIALQNQFNQDTFQVLESLGLMGHFVGDISQPFHNYSDYDGYKTGNGGIHSYYEGASVTYLFFNMEDEIFSIANPGPKRPHSLSTGITFKPISADNTVKDIRENVKMVSEKGLSEIKDILAIDDKDIIESGPENRSKVLENGHHLHARRASPSEGAKKFHDLILPQLARSAKLLALLWDEAYRQAGRPPLSLYHSFEYPLSPADVPLDYALDRNLKKNNK
jgi:hypothetical protein